MFTTTDTIVAIATPQGHGGIGVVRISGADAPRIACGLVGRTSPLRPRYATIGIVRDRASVGARSVDEVVLTWFQAPKSYTGEDVIEVGAHGSPVVLRRIVELAVNAGARLAEPGEFTLRAYLSGRLDLVQAEAVADLVDAVTPLQARAAMDQLEGTLTMAIAAIETSLFDLTARLEASLDFPDEGFHFITREAAAGELAAVGARLDALARDGQRGRMIRDGAIVAIAGCPNAGKSSLFNALVGADRAIVTSAPGTTRDVLSERVDVHGVPVTLLDTAGVREAADAIEAEGVRRARQAHGIARVVLIVLDGSVAMTDDDRELLAARVGERIVVVNKCDLGSAWRRDAAFAAGEDVVDVSAMTGDGLDELRRRLIVRLTGGEELRDTPAVSNARHLALVEDARAAVARGSEAMASGATEELVLAELLEARVSLEAIVGRTSSDDVLHHIFSRFCVGK